MRPVADDRHRIGNFCHFVQLMGDIDAGHALRLEVLDEIEKDARFGCRQRRCRLVENEQLRILVDGLGDLDQLLLAARIVVDRKRDIDVVNIEPRQKFRRTRIHLVVIDKASACRL